MLYSKHLTLNLDVFSKLSLYTACKQCSNIEIWAKFDDFQSRDNVIVLQLVKWHGPKFKTWILHSVGIFQNCVWFEFRLSVYWNAHWTFTCSVCFWSLLHTTNKCQRHLLYGFGKWFLCLLINARIQSVSAYFAVLFEIRKHKSRLNWSKHLNNELNFYQQERLSTETGRLPLVIIFTHI